MSASSETTDAYLTEKQRKIGDDTDMVEQTERDPAVLLRPNPPCPGDEADS